MAPSVTTTASTDHVRELHVRINELSDKFAAHDSRNAERFAGLEQRAKHIEKEQDKQGAKLESIETVVTRMDGKIDAMMASRGNKDTDTTWRKREEAKADIWADRLKKLGIALLAAAALYFGGRGAVDQFTDHPSPEPKESK